MRPSQEWSSIKIKVGTEKAGNNDDSGTVAAGYAETVIDGSCVQEENLGREQRFG